MSFFEFILIMSSVIYALSMAPLLTGLVQLLQFDGSIKFYLPQAIVSVFLVVVVVVVWWTMWWLRDANWTFATYSLVIIEPLIMFFSCSLIFPRKLEGDAIDLEVHYQKIRVPLLTSMLIWFVLVFLDDALVGAEPFWHSRRYIHLFAVSLALWALLDKRHVAQSVLAFGLLGGTFSMVVGWFWIPPN